jgi:LPPG:FO 2-phospho-L-lactate transferase
MSGRVLALAGGVGGAKLAHGLAQAMPPADLAVVVNTGDDFRHWGLAICPDLDTVTYTLADLVNPETGWGRRDETWNCLDSVGALGGETWFRLGDRDLATHLERTRRLAAGESLSSIVAAFCERWGIVARVIPMTDDPAATHVDTDAGVLAFQDWFVRRRCAPAFRRALFTEAERARPHPAFLAALADPGLSALVVCPSNPFVSVAPILALPGVRDAVARCAAPRIAITPIIGGAAVKGPAAKMYTELGIAPTPVAVAEQYRGLVDVFVLDRVDAHLAPHVEALGMRAHVTDALMRDPADRARLAREVLAHA